MLSRCSFNFELRGFGFCPAPTPSLDIFFLATVKDLMKIILALLLLTLLPTSLVAQSKLTVESRPVVFNRVTVIDMTGAPLKPNMTVIVFGNRISAIGKTGKVRLPRNAQMIDASGKFLIPGLWDMHFHSENYKDGRKILPVLVANGITGVRDMASPLEDVLRLRKEVDAGDFVGSRMTVAGPILQGPLPFQMSLLRSIKNEREAKQVVADLKKSGVDFLKVGDALPRDLYFVLAAEAKRQGVSFVGHLPVGVNAAEASNAGQRSIEHFGSVRFHGMLLACSTREGELSQAVKNLLEAAKKGDESADTKLFRAELIKPLLDSFSDEKAAALFARFARNYTWQTPTLIALRSVWSSKRKELSEEDNRYADRIWQKYLEMVKAMRREGVMILAGADLPLENTVSPLHEELSLLVQAGLTPMEALQSATHNPARFLKLKSFGTVERGKVADLVLLDANPLDDIANTKEISAVVAGGRYLSKEKLQEMLRGIEPR